MEEISLWLAELSRNNRTAYALLTVAVTASVGVSLAVIIELVFKVLGINTGRSGHR